MKLKISYSRFSILLTAIISGGLFIGCIATVKEYPAFFIMLGIFLILYFSALFFGPAFITADSNNIILGSLLRTRKIPMDEVGKAEIFQPTMGAIRICASGGFMGYWGIFRENDIGNYYGFYGKSSDCILVRLKSGNKYVLGCDDPQKMVDYIYSQIITGHR